MKSIILIPPSPYYTAQHTAPHYFTLTAIIHMEIKILITSSLSPYQTKLHYTLPHCFRWKLK